MVSICKQTNTQNYRYAKSKLNLNFSSVQTVHLYIKITFVVYRVTYYYALIIQVGAVTSKTSLSRRHFGKSDHVFFRSILSKLFIGRSEKCCRRFIALSFVFDSISLSIIHPIIWFSNLGSQNSLNGGCGLTGRV